MRHFNAFLIAAVVAALPLAAEQGPKVEVINSRTSKLCDADGLNCVSLLTDSRILKITAPEAGATAYLIQIVTPDRDGARRTWSYIVPRSETRFGEFQAATSSTFFSIPIDADIPLFDIWVTALSASGEPTRVKPRT